MKTSELKCFPEVVLFPQISGGHNIHAHVTDVAVRTIREGRELRVQPYNEYRKRFNLKPYTSFREFAGERTVDL